MSQKISLDLEICDHLKPTEVYHKVEELDGVEVNGLRKR